MLKNMINRYFKIYFTVTLMAFVFTIVVAMVPRLIR